MGIREAFTNVLQTCIVFGALLNAKRRLFYIYIYFYNYLTMQVYGASVYASVSAM